MAKGRWRVALMALLTAGCMASCSALTGAPNDLLQAPKATGDIGEIQRALFDYAGSGITLRYPHNGDNRNAFQLVDLDRDGTDEAVVFYAVASSDEESVEAVHINLIDRVDGSWRSVYDAATPGNAIDKVEVADITGNGLKTLMVGVQLFGAGGNQLNLYTYDGKTLTQQAQENYTLYRVADLMGLGGTQLIVYAFDGVEHKATVGVYTFNGEAMETRGIVATDGNILSSPQITLGALSDGQPALFLDAAKSAYRQVTDLVYFGETGLVNPFFDTGLGETQITQRRVTETCRDIDDDGVTEIPSTELLPGFADRSEADALYLTIWSRFDGRRFSEVLCADYFTAGGFRLAFPSRWRGRVTVVTDNANRMRSYRLYDESLASPEDEILRIRAYDIEEYERFNHEGTLELARDDTTVWVARLVITQGIYAVSQEELMTLFSTI